MVRELLADLFADRRTNGAAIGDDASLPHAFEKPLWAKRNLTRHPGIADASPVPEPSTLCLTTMQRRDLPSVNAGP
jgi:hypothetical protein